MRCLLGLSILSALGAVLPGVAGAQTYARKLQNIRAGIVILDTAKPNGSPLVSGVSAAPFALYNLDKAKVKPAGWNIYNPHAPGLVTADIRQRYLDILGIGSTDLPEIGAPITKRNAEYWNVYLGSISDSSLADYDILLVNPRYYASLNPLEREKLRQFVDRGGVLWIDPAGLPESAAGTDETNNFPLAFVTKSFGSGAAFADDTNPLISTPNKLSSNDLQLLHSFNQRSIVQIDPAGDEGAGGLAGQFLPLFAQFYRFQYVSGLGNFPSIATARVGDGYIVVTARGASIQLNRVTGANYTQNTSYSALQKINLNGAVDNSGTGPSLDAEGTAAAKLAINIISLVGDYQQEAGGSRKSSSSSIDLGAPLLARFTAEGSLGTGGANSSPVLYKGLLVATSGNRVIVYDSNPSQDLDGDGDPDDGIGASGGGTNNNFRDTSVGGSVDVVWQSPDLPGPLSPPTCVEIPDVPGGVARNQVLVVDSAGTVHAFDLMLKNAQGQLVGGTHAQLYQLSPPGGNSVYENNPLPVTVSDGLGFVADSVTLGANPQGRVWVIDLATGQRAKDTSDNDWRVGGSGVSGTPLPGSTGSPTVGYIPIQDNSGGMDKVLYVPGIVGSAAQPSFVSLWLGAKGERPASDLTFNPTQVLVPTRAGTNSNLPIYFPSSSAPQGLNPMRNNGVKITLLDLSGNPIPASKLGRYITGDPIDAGSGTVAFTLASGSGKTLFDAEISGVRLDYTIDWGKDPANFTPSIERGRIQLPVPNAALGAPPRRRILGNIAMSPRGTLYVVSANPDSNVGGEGSTLFYFREDAGRGNFRTIARYDLYSRHNIQLNQAGRVNYGPVIEDNDNVKGFAGPILNGEMGSFNFAGGASVRNGVVYVLANSTKKPNPFPVPASALFAFTAEPETPELRIGSNFGTLADSFRLAQPDFARSTDLTQPETFSLLGSGSYSYDKDRGIIRVENLATVTRGQITDCLSLSQPILFRADGSPDRLREPEASGDRWSPLLWYSVFNGAKSEGQPMITGSTAFLAGNSLLPKILSGAPFGSWTTSGLVWAMDTDFGSGSEFVVPTPGRTWLKQVYQIKTGSSTFANPAFRMPQVRGVTSFEQWRTRLNQTVLGTSTKAYGVAGGDNSLVAWSDRGLYSLNRADFLVCDEGRILQVDSSGNPQSTTDSTINSGPLGGGFAGTLRPLIRPSRAYRVGQGETLVVDSGANRVVRFDAAGSEVRSIERYITDPAYRPEGYRANQSTTLNSPRDVLSFSEFVYKGATDTVSNQQPVEFWRHYLIADAGNRRLLELIDRFTVDANGRIGVPVTVNMDDPNTDALDVRPIPQLAVLRWQTPASVSGKNFEYLSIDRTFVSDGLGGGRYVYVAGIGNSQPSRSDAGVGDPANPSLRESATGNGGVVVFDPQSVAGIRVFNTFQLPDLSTTKFWNPATSTFDLLTGISQPFTQRRYFSGLTSVTSATRIGTGGKAFLSLMVTDGNGVYEFLLDPAPAVAPTESDAAFLGVPRWMVNSSAYTVMRGGVANAPLGSNPSGFRPMFARRLDSGEVLLVNGYTGLTRDGNIFKGEIVMLDGNIDLSGDATNGQFGIGKANLGFNSVSIRFELPPLSDIRGLVAPIFADRK